ncbi:PilN domain-containing protein [Microbulbifer sp. JTAC008]|uniref:PilN domain-containing protein n=1 Tax=unclassified Microbulbifer TaxID=2619833 RepID=UPI00403A6233
MAKINLLPWRQEYRAQKQKEFQQLALLVFIAAAAAMFSWKKTADLQVIEQGERNQILQARISELNVQVREIKDLKKRRQELIDRMRVIQELQGNRPLAVRYFDEIVQATPEGLWLSEMKREGDRLDLFGVAESNNRVSSFMRNLDHSDWYEAPQLTGVTATPQYGEQASEFQLTVKVSGRKQEDDKDSAK